MLIQTGHPTIDSHIMTTFTPHALYLLWCRFADAVAEVMQEDSDYVWVHDYHLMCVHTY